MTSNMTPRRILMVSQSRSERYTNALEAKINASDKLELDHYLYTPNHNDLSNDIDLFLVHSDRREILPIVVEAFYRNIPIVQLFAGAVGQGTHDDLARHAITRMASYMFCGSAVERSRLIRWGEDHKRCFVTGGLHMDNADTILAQGKPVWSMQVYPYDLVLVNPETMEDNPSLAAVEAFNLLMKDKSQGVIFCEPNEDPNRKEIIDIFDTYRGNYPGIWTKFPGIWMKSDAPRADFLYALSHCRRFITNSSSAIYEAPYFTNVEVIMVGKRNRDRAKPDPFTGGSEKVVRLLEELPLTLKTSLKYCW